MLPNFISRSKFIEPQRTGSQMGPLVKAALVADNLAWVQGRSAPGRRLGRVAVETPSPEVLSFLGCGIIRVLRVGA